MAIASTARPIRETRKWRVEYHDASYPLMAVGLILFVGVTPAAVEYYTNIVMGTAAGMGLMGASICLFAWFAKPKTPELLGIGFVFIVGASFLSGLYAGEHPAAGFAAGSVGGLLVALYGWRLHYLANHP